MSKIEDYLRCAKQAQTLHAFRNAKIHSASQSNNHYFTVAIYLPDEAYHKSPDVAQAIANAFSERLPGIIEEVEKHVTEVITTAARAATGEASRIIARAVEGEPQAE